MPNTKLFPTVIARAAAVLSAATLLLASAARAESPEILILGSPEEVVAEYKRTGYWGPIAEGAAIEVPPYLTVTTSPTWNKQSASLPVAVKKELFYRSLLPLILYSNETILEDRARLEKAAADPQGADREWLTGLAARYKVLDGGAALPQGESLAGLLGELKTRVDAIPPSLALGQAAYESGYGTSRFAREGNALFGQWTYGGKGMKPKQQRAGKGNYGVAAYDWPLESVRSYMLNLNTHRTYADLRAERAKARSNGQAPAGADLAKTLVRYSEKGQEYVKTLTGIMRVNEIGVADRATLRSEAAIIIIDVPGAEKVAEMRAEIEELRKSGKLAEILAEMGVDAD